MAATTDFAAGIGIAIPPISIVDVGAMSEGVERYAALLSEGLGSVVGFEPNAAELAALRAMQAPRRHYLPDCLGKGGPGILHITRYPGCSSLYHPNVELIELFHAIGAADISGNFFVLRQEPVQTRRLDDVSECPPPDYLKLDVQGAELDVLEGAQRRWPTRSSSKPKLNSYNSTKTNLCSATWNASCEIGASSRIR